MEPTVITIITERLPEAVKALKKLAAKAERYGTPKVTWSVAAPRAEKRRTEDGRTVSIQVTDITLGNLEAPRVGAFRFLARLERTPAGTIIDSIAGEDLPERFRNTTGECEHCGKVRDRKHLFVVCEDGGEPVQVGRSCLRDYMGTDTPESVASRFRFERELGEFSDEWSLGSGPVTDSAAELLAVTATAIRLWGWVPKSAPEGSGTPTSSRISVWFYLPPGNKSGKEDLDALKAAISDADWEEAGAAFAWVMSNGDDSEYMHNLRTILVAGVVEPKRRGYACSAVAAHQRALGLLELKRREREASANSHHVGVVGERLRGLELTVLSNRGFSGQFGDSVLYKMRDEAGNVFTWFKSGDGIMDVGNTYILDATVKAHTSYQGVLETQLTRAKKPGV
jgi:hypothetical protein